MREESEAELLLCREELAYYRTVADNVTEMELLLDRERRMRRLTAWDTTPAGRLQDLLVSLKDASEEELELAAVECEKTSRSLRRAAMIKRQMRAKEEEDSASNGQRFSSSSLCCICQDAAKSVLLLPCRHLCLCQICVLQGGRQTMIEMCPICRETVTEHLRVFT